MRPVGGTVSLVDAGGVDVAFIPTAAGYYYVDEFGGGLQFDPHIGFSGTAPTVDYVITNAAGQSATSTYTATVTKPPPPTAAPLSSTRPGGPYYQYADTNGITGNISAAYLISGGAQVASLAVAGKGTYYAEAGDGITLSFQADSCFVGTVPAVTYRIIDQYAQHADSTYTAHVTNPDPPTASPLTSTGSGPTAQTVTAPQPDCVGSTKLLNAGGQPVTVLTRSDGTYTVAPATGVITYTPAPGYSGTGTPVTYRVTDQYGQHTDSSYTTTVTSPPPPTAAALTSTGVGPAAQHVTAAVPPAGRATLRYGANSVSTVTIAGQGTYAVNATTGVITFTPEAGYLGAATPVSYQVTDSYHHSATSTYTATVTEPAAPNPPAVTSTGVGTAVQSRTVTIPPAGEVTLLDGSTPVTTLAIAGQGIYHLNRTTGSIMFTPALGYVGAATPARYTVTDSYGQSGTSTYTPTVTIPAPPTVSALTSSATADTTQQRAVTIPSGGAVTLIHNSKAVATVTDAEQGTYTLDTATGVITFTPLGGYTGHPTPVTYQVTDAYGQTVRSTYTPDVIAAPATTSTTAPPTAPTTTTAATAPTSTAAPTTTAPGSLPYTGVNAATLTQIAALFMLLGAALIAATRYRRHPRPGQHQ